MLSDVVDLFLTPIRYCFSLLADEVWFDYMGVTPLAIACTGIIVLLVMKALLTPVSIGALASYKVRTSNTNNAVRHNMSPSNAHRISSGGNHLLKGG